MPAPTRNQAHLSAPLQSFTIAAMQDDADFVAYQVSPFVPVDHRTNKYYKYDVGAFNRLEMQPRGVSEESAGSGWTLSNDSYDCIKYSVHKDLDWDDIDDADEAIDEDADAGEWLANQVRMYADNLWAAAAFKAGVWTTDYTGVSGSPSGAQFKQWDQATSDPQSDVITIGGKVKDLIFKQPNMMVVGQDVHRKVITNAVVRDALKYTDPTMVRVVEAKLAAFFGMDKYIVAGGAYNSAEEGQTATIVKLLNSKGAWLGYVNPSPGKKKISATYTFAWKGKRRAAVDGITAWKFDIQQKETTRHEVDMNVAVKIIAADAGAFLASAIA